MEMFTTLWPLLQPVAIALVVQGGKMGLDAVRGASKNETIKKFLPYVSGILGAAWAALSNDPHVTIVQGAVAGFAATGLHQAATQPVAVVEGKK